MAKGDVVYIIQSEELSLPFIAILDEHWRRKWQCALKFEETEEKNNNSTVRKDHARSEAIKGPQQALQCDT